MGIRKITGNKKAYLPLLLLGDEQEDMIDRYLERCDLYVWEDGGVKAVCAVTDEGGILEIKNIAVAPEVQRQGIGRRMLQFIEDTYRDAFAVLQVGTGDSPLTIPFYETCGFVQSHVVKNFFTDHYDHPIFEGGRQLRDMIVLQKRIERPDKLAMEGKVWYNTEETIPK